MDGGNPMSRYDRQIAVAEFGPSGQKQLAKTRMLMVGAGGLASPALQYLVGAGLGHIRLVDPDVVALDNMHRQTIFRLDDLGMAKAEAATKHMKALNSECRITPVTEPITPDNMARHADGVDIVLDCADSFAVSYSLSDFCYGQLPLVHASVIGTAGYAGGFCYDAPSLRAVFPDLPARLGSCAEDGVLGPVVGIIGALQAQMALAIITGADPSPLGQLVTYDAAGNRFGGFRFNQAQEPEAAWPFIGLSQIGDDDMVVDLRHPSEGPPIVPQSHFISLDDITSQLPAEHTSRMVLCCQSGQRAWAAAEKLTRIWPGPIALMAAGYIHSTMEKN
jgi:molybdopterin/thiamine biosynthesis adenylyltransferase